MSKTYILPSTSATVHPAPERVESHRVTINGERRTIHICAYGWETRYSWGHTAYCPELGVTDKARYYNRTWESYRFESVIKGCLYKCRMLDKGFRARERRKARRIREEAERRAKARAEAEAREKTAAEAVTA